MSTVKDLFENEELMKNLTDDIEVIPEDSKVGYEVWAIGYDKNNHITDDEVLVGEFTDSGAAIGFAENVEYDLIREFGEGEPDPETVYFSIEVETVVEVTDEEEALNTGTFNIGTVYSRDLWIDGECGDEADIN